MNKVNQKLTRKIKFDCQLKIHSEFILISFMFSFENEDRLIWEPSQVSEHETSVNIFFEFMPCLVFGNCLFFSYCYVFIGSDPCNTRTCPILLWNKAERRDKDFVDSDTIDHMVTYLDYDDHI